MNFLEDKNKNLIDKIYLNNLPPLSGGQTIRNIVYGNGKFVALASVLPSNSGPAYTILNSKDGVDWSIVTSGVSTFSFSNICFLNGIFVVFSMGGYPSMLYSYNGINWIGASTNVSSIATYGNGKYVGIKNIDQYSGFIRLSTSNDGLSWTTVSSSLLENFNYQFNDIQYGYSPTHGHIFVTVGSAGSGTSKIAFSTDGENWQQINLPVNDNWYSIAYANNKFVAIGSSEIIYSENGTAWSVASRPSGTSFLIARKIIFSNGKFYIFGANAGPLPNYCLISIDGINWSTLNLTPVYANWSRAATNNENIVILPDNVGSGGITQIIGSRSGRFQFIKQSPSNNKKIMFLKN